MKQVEDVLTEDFEDVLLWPCGTWCSRYELGEYLHKSDDFSVLYFGTPEYEAFIKEQDE